MQHVDYLLSGGMIVTMNGQFDLIPDGSVAILGTSIVAVGTKAAVEAEYTANEVIDCAGKFVLPGLVNAHTHVPMTLLRGLADDLRLDVWLLGYVMPAERAFVTPEFCRLGTSLACAEMIRSGITAFADMYYFEEEIAAAAAEAGMRGVLGQSILKFPSPDAETYEKSLARARQFIESWQDHPLITPAVAPHAPYSNTDEIMRECVDLAVETGAPLLIHLAETRLELENSLEAIGMSVIQHMQAIDLFRAKVLAAHCVHIDQADMHLLKQGDASVAHCPTSNLKLASGIAPVTQMLKSGLVVGIGTDGPASNNDLDMFEEIRLAAILAKTDANDPTALPARQALLMATRQGAEALFIGDKTGSLEAGKLADVLIMDGQTLHSLPHFSRDPNAVYSQIVYAGHSADVRHVFCNGKLLMRDRELLTIAEADLLQRANALAQEIDVFMKRREASLLSRLLAMGELERSESFEVQAKAAVSDSVNLDSLLRHPDVQVIKTVHYKQYDTYFEFPDSEEGRVRYREDALIGNKGEIQSVRARLTLTETDTERDFHSTIRLSRARFIADATQPLRFYREYFRPQRERELEKDRLRWHIHFRGVLFYINLDRVLDPALPGQYLEIKSRTWSASDAEYKADLIHEMLGILGILPSAMITEGYLEMQPAG
ncbi:MAG: putative hydrolase [Chloroflexi bacterium OLB15]|nr:MAG: putative hydrolase [Chloroflexi bacterium OLB15]